MDALEILLRPVVSLVNRRISMTTPARELCADLEGRVFAIRVSNTSLAAYVRVEAEAVALSGEYTADPDVVIEGSLLSLASLPGPGGEQAIRDGIVKLTGDAEDAAKLQRLLYFGRPDIEEELSGIVGDVAAHELGEIARAIGRRSRQATEIMQQNVGEYLTEESRSLPTRREVDEFAARVNTLRDDVARLEARLRKIDV